MRPSHARGRGVGRATIGSETQGYPRGYTPGFRENGPLGLLDYSGAVSMPRSERLPAHRVLSHLVVMAAVSVVLGVVVAGLAIPFAGLAGSGPRTSPTPWTSCRRS